ncbi:integrin alpha-3-like isoform X2 [Cololabis saira]|uniref:integrin alpha-3-like isoform X2 n=1 Tax=Cololabis saira TaxID=129043 RepID=UPI002AD59A88|nr:integrin alpha-3-like isoform X2 [Cololabis saira]XP_061568314.1 integrin alpha-3-like isoform X2 [Cololabis saira]
MVTVSMATGLCVLLSASMYASMCAAFNVDTAFPLLKTGDRGSLFGLSVALHPDLGTETHLLLVGAPREKAEPGVPANRTGGVYSCPITAHQSDCKRMKLVDPGLNPSEDLVEDMWLGVSVSSQGRPGGRVLVCGHRFVKLYGAFKLRHMIGRCYLRGNDLRYDDDDPHWQNPDQPCSHLGDVSTEAMCNMGMSAAITDTEVIVGSPGSYEWQGNVHVSWMNPEVVFDTQKTSFSNLRHRNIYIGYSVTRGRRLLSRDQETIVTGAPKDRKEDVRGSVLLAVKRAGRLVVMETLRGKQMGSYFGNAVATADVNDDGWDDLLVGAPFYFLREQEVGGAVYVYLNRGGSFPPDASAVLTGPAGSAFGMSVSAAGDLDQDGVQDFAVGAPFHDSGSVMIWYGSRGGISEEPGQVIRGSSVSPAFSSFGYSLSPGLDVDGNGFPDLLVGSLDDTVALLRSRPVVRLNKTLRVSPEVVDPNGCDLCIQVEVCFSYSISGRQRSDKDDITVVFSVSADVTSLKPRLLFQDGGTEFQGRLSLQRGGCERLRVGLQDPVQDQVEPLVFSLNASLDQRISQNQEPVPDLKHFPVLSQTPRPIRTQIHIQKSCGPDNRCHSNLQMTAQFTDEDQRPFPRRGGGDSGGSASGQVLLYDGGLRRLLLQVNVSNAPSEHRPAEDAHNAVLNISVPPSLVYAGVQTQGPGPAVDCSDEDLVLLCKLGNPFRTSQEVQVLIKFQPSEISLDTREIRTRLQLNTLSEQDDLDPVLVSMTMEFSLQTSLSLTRTPGPVFFGGEDDHVIGESAMETTEDVGSLLLFQFQVHVAGRLLGRHGDLELEFQWPMETRTGKWLLYITQIQLEGTTESSCRPGNIVNPLNLPLTEEKRQKRRRSLEEEKEEEKQKRRRSLEEEKEEEKQKRRRSLEEEKKEEKLREQEDKMAVRHLQGRKRKSYLLDCVLDRTCVTFTCPLVNMSSSAALTVRSRVWTGTLVEDFSDAGSVAVRVRATLRLRTDKPAVLMDPQTSQVDVHIYPEPGLQVDSSAPLWIIVVSVLAGVLLLALIVLMLWKCGFFRRASTRERYQAQTQKARVKTQPSESRRLTEEF